MFGGSGGSNSFNDLYKFDLRQSKWSKLEPVGEVPTPREGHIGKIVGRDRMMIMGGIDSNERSFDDTYILTGISQFMDSS
jgi:N-acetylneuraminic acid mutarotase